MSTVADQTPARTAGRRIATGAMRWLAPLATFVVLLVLWDLATRVFDWPVWLVPTPGDVAEALWDNRSILADQTWVTLQETLGGFLLAAVIGLPLAMAITTSHFLELTIYPILLALNAVPKIAIAPILVLWMGFGPGPKIVVAMLLCVFPIVISTATGLQATPPELVELTRSLTASRRQTFLKARFPAAMPHIFVGLKVAISLAVIGAVIGEFVGSSEGLGWVILNTQSNLDTPLAFASMVLLAALSIVLFYILVALERFLVPWAQHETKD